MRHARQESSTEHGGGQGGHGGGQGNHGGRGSRGNRGSHGSHSALGDRARTGTPEAMSADELRKDIERTREDLGATVEGLAAKADVKARALRAVDGGKQAVAGAPGKAARTAKSAVGAVGPRRLVAGAVSAVVTACAVRAVARGAAARRTRTRGPRRRPPGA